MTLPQKGIHQHSSYWRTVDPTKIFATCMTAISSVTIRPMKREIESVLQASVQRKLNSHFFPTEIRNICIVPLKILLVLGPAPKRQKPTFYKSKGPQYTH